MKNNVCLWILVIIAIVLIVWWLSQPTFMRIRPVESMRYKVGDAKKGCCEFMAGDVKRWMTRQECVAESRYSPEPTRWDPTMPKSQCHLPTVYDDDAKKGCCEVTLGYGIDSPTRYYWETEHDCVGRGWTSYPTFWDPTKPKDQCHA